jgi:hypothetical protein
MANAIVKYNGKPKTNSWARWMVGRTMKQNKNNLISVVGKTGSGKTYTAISICEIMSKMDGVPFNVKEHVVFTLKELMDLINSGKLRRGSKIVCDEFQCSISAREFQSKANKVFNYVLSTFRHLNLTLFFCTPFETLLDKNTRKLFHAKFETMSINKNNQTCRIKPRFLEYSDFKAEPYRKQMYIFFKDDNGNNKSRQLFWWDIPRPSKESEEIYEKMKVDFTTRLNKNISLDLANDKSLTDKQEDVIQERKPLTDKQEKVMRVLANIKESNKYEVASKKLGISLNAIHQNKKLAEKKGYSLQEFKEDGE